METALLSLLVFNRIGMPLWFGVAGWTAVSPNG
jgi:hypothetical protein